MIIKLFIYIHKGVEVVEWYRALDVRLSEWCCSVSMVWVQILSRENRLLIDFFLCVYDRVYKVPRVLLKHLCLRTKADFFCVEF